jgi:hypothetical protein
MTEWQENGERIMLNWNGERRANTEKKKEKRKEDGGTSLSTSLPASLTGKSTFHKTEDNGKQEQKERGECRKFRHIESIRIYCLFRGMTYSFNH